MNKLILAIAVCAACTSTLRAQSPPMSAADVQFFEAKIRPVLSERCFSCHSTKAKKLRGGLHLDSRAALLKGGDSGPALVPGQVEKSLLVKAIRYHDASLEMPPSGKLPEKEIALLEEWVRRGAPFPAAKEATAAKPTINLAEGRKFWSFQPPRTMPAPAIKNQAWVQRPIDAFILAELEKRELAPTEAASRQVLIRRATFDLLGLPPTPEEVANFVNDAGPDAYARLIDRLLASPHHGERWGRFWLDLARYCDVGEPWSDNKAPAYIYRDWVVRAFNEDVPFDQFVMKQLAADQMPEASPRDRAALGFIGLSPSYWKELNLDKDVIRMVVAEEWEERIHTLASTFLGLTAACARCHDHKFDPITMQDYYALAGVFASTRLADRPLLADADAQAVRKATARVRELQAQLDKLTKAKGSDPKAIDALKKDIEQVKKSTPNFDAPQAPGVEDASLHVLAEGKTRTKLEYKAGIAQDVAMQIRGNPVNEGPVVPRRFLAVLSPSPETPKAFSQGSGRLELARAIVTEGAPLSARVIVNRIWRQHFGVGLVETPSDFGSQGERPSHPELLDDLTARFLANGWSIRWLHREIMLSATYQQSSKAPRASKELEKAAKIDPDNRKLWHMNRRRLDVESWRDAMLAVTGTLDPTLGGPAQDLSNPKNARRTLYGSVKRRELHDLLRLYDFPDPTTHNATRVPTTTPLQQLFTLNSPFMQQQAAALIRRLQKEAPNGAEAKIQRAYLLLFGRPATAGQTRLALEFLRNGMEKGPIADAMWEQYAQVLLASNEFMFVD